MGYALIAFSTGTHIGIQMLLFYLVIYIIAGLATWFIILLLRVKRSELLGNKYNKELGDMTLLQQSNSALAFAFSLTMFSIAGIPPMVGFLAKMSVFLSVVHGISLFFVALLVFYLV
jgi:NADH-quinone oxidoreductase subunit N